MRLKYLYIIVHLLSLYCNIGENANTSISPAIRACQKIMKNYKPSTGNYIVSGTEAALGEFPYMVALADEYEEILYFHCGGSLISLTFVLTAAHCIYTDIVLVVRAGSLYVNNTKFDPKTDKRVAEYYMPPRYISILPEYHDIAILRLDSPVKPTANLSPICLETNDANPKGQLVVTGWGTIKEKGPTSPVLLKAFVVAIPLANCSVIYNKYDSPELLDGLTKDQLCANDPTGKHQDTCQGDSGGPLANAAKDGKRRLVGVTSFGRGCGEFPGVYARVSRYVPWIVSIVWPN